MKKIISVLILTFAVMMLSSCLWVINSDDITTNYYDITCYNDSDTKVTDWCVVRNGKKTFAKSTNSTGIPVASHATLYNLPEGDYVLYVAFVNSPDYDKGDYVQSKKFTLNKNYSVHVDQTFADEYWNNRK